MNTYEFWDEMDKIFDAIVAYQEKTIEFNKRFINPWVNLGNVFNKQESEAIAAHKNTIKIDPDNAQNWYDLAGTYMRSGHIDNSIYAYQKAIELGFESGELYKNLGLAHAMIAKHQEAIPFFQKALDLLDTDKDKVVVWNHIGNVYRKLNNYDLALQAFQNADQIEHAVISITEELPFMEADEEATEDAVAQVDESSIPQTTDEPATAMDNDIVPKDADINNSDDTTSADVISESEQTEDHPVEELGNVSAIPAVHEDEPLVAEENQTGNEDDEIDGDMSVILDVDFSTDSPAGLVEETVIDDVEGVTIEDEQVVDAMPTLEEDEKPLAVETVQEEPEVGTVASEEKSFAEILASLEKDGEAVLEAAEEEESENDTEDIDFPPNFTETSLVEQSLENQVLEDSEVEPTLGTKTSPVLSAYEEYLKDNDPGNIKLPAIHSEENQSIAMAPSQVEVTNSEINVEDVGADLTVDIDTKNACVWNELGNVYFNAGSYDDAITAYSRAIELDKQFAWPYTNMALSYVQKGRLDEAINLYQRSIELLSSEKDKAVTWNRLGNVYRRLNDYDNAIAAYQRADELDPGNTAITHQSRFSLLGNEKVGQEAGYSL